MKVRTADAIIAIILTVMVIVFILVYYHNMLKYRTEILKLKTMLNACNKERSSKVKTMYDTNVDDFPIKEGDIWAFKTPKGTIVFTGTVKRVLKDIGMVSYYSSVDHGGTNVVMRAVEDFLNVFNTKLA